MPAVSPLRFARLLAALFLPALTAIAADGVVKKSAARSPLVEPPADAIQKLKAHGGLRVDLFAAEPDLANPVAFTFDARGRCYVVESFRRRTSALDIRQHAPWWVDAEFSLRTVEDRAAFLRREIVPENTATMKRLSSGKLGVLEDFNRDGTTNWMDLEVQSERLRVLMDTDGDGRADVSSVFAEGFTNLTAGVAAGVVTEGTNLYFTALPDLWKMTIRETGPTNSPASTNAPVADNIRSLLTGFGVHVAFGGHDMHGAIFGPDGRLYWSIADRGTSTNLWPKITNRWPGLTQEALADSGAIFRAHPDGSGFEVVAIGLRNPQELAFDDFGNLFTADNNGDGGDPARWHHVLEGADHGWRLGWQWLPKMGPWNAEQLWAAAPTNTAAWVLPPIAHIGHGPAGLAHYPGTGLPARYADHFFLCDFPGSVLMWTNRPAGASFTIGPVTPFLGELGPTDIAFGPDGGAYVSDWFKTFEKTGKGRIYRVHDPATDASKEVQEVKRLLAEGMNHRPFAELTNLLGHADRRVRMAAQFAAVDKVITNLNSELLIDKDDYNIQAEEEKRWSDYNSLTQVALNSTNRMARIHSIWALGQVAQLMKPNIPFKIQLSSPNPRQLTLAEQERFVRNIQSRMIFSGYTRDVQKLLIPLFKLTVDADPEIQIQALRTLKQMPEWRPSDALIQEMRRASPRLEAWRGDWVQTMLNDPNPQVRLAAIGVMWRRGRSHGWKALLNVMNDPKLNTDCFIQHAAVAELAGIIHDQVNVGHPILRREPTYLNMKGQIIAMLEIGSAYQLRSGRLGQLLVLRRLESPEAARFLSDPDPSLRLEAARAIYDVPIPYAMPALAATLASLEDTVPAPLLRRVLNAHYRLGQSSNATALALFAARPAAPAELRIEALELLAAWEKPAPRDRFLGLHRPLPAREARPAADALTEILPALKKSAPAEVLVALTKAASALGLRDTDSWGTLANTRLAPALRAEALRALAAAGHAKLPQAITLALADDSAEVRLAGMEAQAARDPQAAAGLFTVTLARGKSTAEKQRALAGLGALPAGLGEAAIEDTLASLLAGKLPAELRLDTLEAARARLAAKSASEAVLARFQSSLATHESRRDANDPLAPWRETLTGGDAARGKIVFFEKQDAGCLRCHKWAGEGGEVGPDLAKTLAGRPREQVLESIVLPNRAIAPGYESAVLTLKDGRTLTGVVRGETDTHVSIYSAEDLEVIRVPKADITTRAKGASAMPDGLGDLLTRRELRDLVEFLTPAN